MSEYSLLNDTALTAHVLYDLCTPTPSHSDTVSATCSSHPPHKSYLPTQKRYNPLTLPLKFPQRNHDSHTDLSITQCQSAQLPHPLLKGPPINFVSYIWLLILNTSTATHYNEHAHTSPFVPYANVPKLHNQTTQSAPLAHILPLQPSTDAQIPTLPATHRPSCSSQNHDITAHSAPLHSTLRQ